jgi:hypothetical protein
MGRITVPGQPGQILYETPSPKMDWRCGSRTPVLIKNFKNPQEV